MFRIFLFSRAKELTVYEIIEKSNNIFFLAQVIRSRKLPHDIYDVVHVIQKEDGQKINPENSTNKQNLTGT